MEGWLGNIGAFFVNIMERISLRDVFDVLFVAVLVYAIIQLTRKTRAFQVLKGFGLLLAVYWAADFFQLATLTFLLDTIVLNTAVIMVVLFHPELRKAFEQIGRQTFVDRRSTASRDDRQYAIDAIVEACLALSRRKVGVLIVMERRTGLSDVIESGTHIDSVITAALLENIFEPKTPLHDGAVIIHGTRIIAAACVLPLTENQVSRELGTRHRAGLGMTETTDAISLIVSEETGTISAARAGRLTRYLDADSLRALLEEIYEVNVADKKGLPFSFFRREGN